ncbi:hypothetical protein KQI38_09695 [Tissierella carlieri]|uniref:hypothetical protein n=1 Tax=Tissierella carlieri TaxID=689904 RepID=UPI001C121463|nr:hypothetical protein [Tissierella carlieri]MBU5312301.1 hypothetical protein [Tissierella carlieri]
MSEKSRREKTKLNIALSDILEGEFDTYLNFHQIDTVIDLIEYYKIRNIQDPEWMEAVKEIRARREKKKNKKKDIELKQENEELKKLMRDVRFC